MEVEDIINKYNKRGYAECEGARTSFIAYDSIHLMSLKMNAIEELKKCSKEELIDYIINKNFKSTYEV